jgi:hypothetical protein
LCENEGKSGVSIKLLRGALCPTENNRDLTGPESEDLSRRKAFVVDPAEKTAVAAENVHRVSGEIVDQDVPIRADIQPCRAVEFARPASFRSKGTDNGPVDAEFLDFVVSGIEDENASFAVDGDVRRVV